MVLDEVVAGFSLWDRFRNWRRSKQEPAAESIASRFVRLFESHDVHRNQIPRFFGHDLNLKDVQDDASLLAKLDEQMLDAACVLFAVRREWLDGAETQIYPVHDFYQNPENVAGFLENLKVNNPDGDLNGVLLAPEEVDGEALLVLCEIVGAVGDKPIYRYHLCNNWAFSYWKSRAYLTALVAIAWKQAVHLRGAYLPKVKIESIANGEALLAPQGDGVWVFIGRKWYPEEMALKPDDFLRGIDPEFNNFGITAGLELWLSLEQQGYMATGLSMYKREDIRRGFEQELARQLPIADTV